MPTTDAVIRELHESSLALLTALRERSPQFLEYLERREHALLALKTLPATLRDMPLLQAAVVAGEAAALEASHMRQESVNALNRLQSQRLFSRGLSAAADQPCAALDLKA
ncbi:MAG: hypothetical protein IPP47_10370 [Bryobacterales bacterium]|nr:hypothetical protein [Bryobacterales bacterium]